MLTPGCGTPLAPRSPPPRSRSIPTHAARTAGSASSCGGTDRSARSVLPHGSMSANEFRFDGHRPEGVLLLHGLTGTPAEMRVLGESLAADGYSVHAPLLPGRGTRPEDMHSLCWEDWMDAALRAYDALAERHESVGVGGVSAGGTLALDLALRRGPAALLLYATALAIRDRIAYITPYIWRT